MDTPHAPLDSEPGAAWCGGKKTAPGLRKPQLRPWCTARRPTAVLAKLQRFTQGSSALAWFCWGIVWKVLAHVPFVAGQTRHQLLLWPTLTLPLRHGHNGDHNSCRRKHCQQSVPRPAPQDASGRCKAVVIALRVKRPRRKALVHHVSVRTKHWSANSLMGLQMAAASAHHPSCHQGTLDPELTADAPHQLGVPDLSGKA